MNFEKLWESITEKGNKLKGISKKAAAILMTALLLNVGTPQEAQAQNFRDVPSTHEPSKQKKEKSLDELIVKRKELIEESDKIIEESNKIIEEKSKTIDFLKWLSGVLFVLSLWVSYLSFKENREIDKMDKNKK